MERWRWLHWTLQHRQSAWKTRRHPVHKYAYLPTGSSWCRDLLHHRFSLDWTLGSRVKGTFWAPAHSLESQHNHLDSGTHSLPASLYNWVFCSQLVLTLLFRTLVKVIVWSSSYQPANAWWACRAYARAPPNISFSLLDFCTKCLNLLMHRTESPKSQPIRTATESIYRLEYAPLYHWCIRWSPTAFQMPLRRVLATSSPYFEGSTRGCSGPFRAINRTRQTNTALQLYCQFLRPAVALRWSIFRGHSRLSWPHRCSTCQLSRSGISRLALNHPRRPRAEWPRWLSWERRWSRCKRRRVAFGRIHCPGSAPRSRAHTYPVGAQSPLISLDSYFKTLF